MIRDLEHNVKFTQVVDPVVITADANGASVDLLGYKGVTFVAQVGESGDTLSTTAYVELEVEDSADDSTFADCADSLITNAVDGNNDGTFGVINAAAEDDAYYETTYKGPKRYVRPVINVSGTHSNGIPISILAIRFGAKVKPVSN